MTGNCFSNIYICLCGNHCPGSSCNPYFPIYSLWYSFARFVSSISDTKNLLFITFELLNPFLFCSYFDWNMTRVNVFISSNYSSSYLLIFHVAFCCLSSMLLGCSPLMGVATAPLFIALLCLDWPLRLVSSMLKSRIWVLHLISLCFISISSSFVLLSSRALAATWVIRSDLHTSHLALDCCRDFSFWDTEFKENFISLSSNFIGAVLSISFRNSWSSHAAKGKILSQLSTSSDFFMILEDVDIKSGASTLKFNLLSPIWWGAFSGVIDIFFSSFFRYLSILALSRFRVLQDFFWNVFSDSSSKFLSCNPW